MWRKCFSKQCIASKSHKISNVRHHAFQHIMSALRLSRFIVKQNFIIEVCSPLQKEATPRNFCTTENWWNLITSSSTAIFLVLYQRILNHEISTISINVWTGSATMKSGRVFSTACYIAFLTVLYKKEDIRNEWHCIYDWILSLLSRIYKSHKA